MKSREIELITPEENEKSALSKMEKVLNGEKSSSFSAHRSLPKLVGPGGETIEIPLSVFRVLQRIVAYMVQGKVFSVIPHDQTLTTQEAADILNVSRPFLVKLLESGELPFVKVGAHRRVQYGDLLAYKDRRHRERLKALAEIDNISQEAGEY